MNVRRMTGCVIDVINSQCNSLLGIFIEICLKVHRELDKDAFIYYFHYAFFSLIKMNAIASWC